MGFRLTMILIVKISDECHGPWRLRQLKNYIRRLHRFLGMYFIYD